MTVTDTKKETRYDIYNIRHHLLPACRLEQLKWIRSGLFVDQKKKKHKIGSFELKKPSTSHFNDLVWFEKIYIYYTLTKIMILWHLSSLLPKFDKNNDPIWIEIFGNAQFIGKSNRIQYHDLIQNYWFTTRVTWLSYRNLEHY